MTTKYPKATEPMDIATLRECFEYDPATGRVLWLPRPRAHFADDAAWRTQHTRDAGRLAGGLDGNGYRRVSVVVSEFQYQISHHWIAWALTYGSWPAQYLDHRNGVRTDNRIENLREATKQQNQRNRGKSTKNTTGLKFVSRGRWGKGFQANAVINGKNLYMGHFPTAEEAHAAAVARLKPIYGEFLNDGADR